MDRNWEYSVHTELWIQWIQYLPSSVGLESLHRNHPSGHVFSARVPSNPVPDNAIINMLFVAGENNGNFAEFTGSGSVANGKMTGTGSCSPSTPICQGVSATFSGNKQ